MMMTEITELLVIAGDYLLSVFLVSCSVKEAGENKSEDPENIALLRMNDQKPLSEPILLSEHWRGIMQV